MDISDDYINKDLRNNKKESYKFLFRKYYMDMVYYALSFGISIDDAKDLTQSAFVKLWENRASIQDEKPVKYFLMSILKNNCLDFIKHTKIVQGYMSNPANTDPFQGSSGTPYDKLTEKELELKIIDAIAGLPEKCRHIFELSRFKGMKNAEIAQKLNISVKTVENQMTIALDKLRTRLKDYFPILFILFYKLF